MQLVIEYGLWNQNYVLSYNVGQHEKHRLPIISKSVKKLESKINRNEVFFSNFYTHLNFIFDVVVLYHSKSTMFIAFVCESFLHRLQKHLEV